jgi:MFS family permease
LLRPYVVVLRQPGVAAPLLASFLGSLLIGMLELSVLLLARLKTGSFVEGGLVTAVLGLGNAIGIVVQGSLIDRRGQTAVLVPAALLCMTALLSLLVVVTELSGSAVLACFLAFVAGLSVPATPSSVRSLLAATIGDPGLRVSAYALVAVSFTAALVLSPLVVSGLLLVAGPGAAVVVSSLLAGVSGLVFARTRASRRWRPAAVLPPWRPSGLATAGMRTLLSINLAVGLLAGLVNVAVPAVALAHGAPALAGALFAVAAVGDLVGGLVYGARPWRTSLARRLIAAQAWAAVSAGCLALTVHDLAALMAAMFLAGLGGSARGVTMSALLDYVGHADAGTESYASMVSAGLLGSSGGYSGGGALVGTLGPRLVFLTVATGSAAVALWALVRHGTLERGAPSSQRPASPLSHGQGADEDARH